MRNEISEIKVGGMICRACTEAVETALLGKRGVISAKASYFKRNCTVEYDPDVVSLEDIENCINAAGYTTGDKHAADIAVDIICAALTVLLVWFLLSGKLNAIPEASEGISLGGIFLIGLLTSTHCVCMCGGIMLSQTARGNALGAGRSAPLISSLSYNGGRVISYTVMGAIFGGLGIVISYTVKIKSLVFTMAGLIIVLIGINMWGILPGLRALAPQQSSYCSAVSAGRKKLAGKPLAIGLLTGLMPCAPLYAMWLFAMSSGSAVNGALSMLVFALGTVPLMLIFGAVNSFIPRKWMKYMLKLSAVLVTAMGAKMLINGLMISGFF